MTFVKGKSGNPSGRPKSNLLKLLAKHLEEKDPVRKKKRALLVVEKMVEAAIEGQDWAQKMVWDRMEGKLKELVSIEDADGKKLTIQVVSFAPPVDEVKS